MSNQKQKKSAKDMAFDRERIRLHSIIQKKDEEINRLTSEVQKYKLEAESWEMTAKILEGYIGIPKEEIISNIERSKKISNLLDSTLKIADTIHKIGP